MVSWGCQTQGFVRANVPLWVTSPASEVTPFLNAQLNVEDRYLRVTTARTGFQKFAEKEEILLMSSSVKWKVRESDTVKQNKTSKQKDQDP